MELRKNNVILTILVASICTISSAQNSRSKKVCFRPLGCFSMEEPWFSIERPIPAPISPQLINTRIFFYSGANINKKYEIILRPTVDLNGAPLNRSQQAVFLVHGFGSSSYTPWMKKFKDAYLSIVGGNVMLVDWGPGAVPINYYQSSSNTRVVGAEIAHLVEKLEINPQKVHIIGHSLGSHVAAYAGKKIKGAGRITALDPAQPAFEGYDASVRLHAEDADFVDVIHTDAKPFSISQGLGMMNRVGHVDFYLNGGYDQPGCNIINSSKISSFPKIVKTPLQVLSNFMPGCSHGRAVEYFIESVANSEKCVFWGHKASDDFKTVGSPFLGQHNKVSALSPTCYSDDCIPLGLRTKLSPLRGSFVVNTNAQPPFCINEKISPQPQVLASPINKIFS